MKIADIARTISKMSQADLEKWAAIYGSHELADSGIVNVEKASRIATLYRAASTIRKVVCRIAAQDVLLTRVLCVPISYDLSITDDPSGLHGAAKRDLGLTEGLWLDYTASIHPDHIAATRDHPAKNDVGAAAFLADHLDVGIDRCDMKLLKADATWISEIYGEVVVSQAQGLYDLYRRHIDKKRESIMASIIAALDDRIISDEMSREMRLRQAHRESECDHYSEVEATTVSSSHREFFCLDCLRVRREPFKKSRTH